LAASISLDQFGHTLSKPNEKRVLDDNQVHRAISRISHEILEKNGGAVAIVLIGIHTRGAMLAHRLYETVQALDEDRKISVGTLDVGLYRDDFSRGARPRVRPTIIPVPLDNRLTVLIDDVLYTGRTVRAAMNALIDFGRPQQIQLGVLVDRGHRELPIKADYVGKNMPTSRDEEVRVRIKEKDGLDEVVIVNNGK
jgi:pyrimidine operon attenuation protein/uracil phosphoribosyltransferase